MMMRMTMMMILAHVHISLRIISVDAW